MPEAVARFCGRSGRGGPVFWNERGHAVVLFRFATLDRRSAVFSYMTSTDNGATPGVKCGFPNLRGPCWGPIRRNRSIAFGTRCGRDESTFRSMAKGSASVLFATKDEGKDLVRHWWTSRAGPGTPPWCSAKMASLIGIGGKKRKNSNIDGKNGRWRSARMAVRRIRNQATEFLPLGNGQRPSVDPASLRPHLLCGGLHIAKGTGTQARRSICSAQR